LKVPGLTNVPSPLVLPDDRVLVSGQGVDGTRLLKVTKDGEKFAVKELWKTDPQFFYCNWVVSGGTLHGAAKDGFVAVSLKDGEVLWADRKWKDANVLLASGVPLVLSGKGRLARCEFTDTGVKETSGFDAVGRAWTPPSAVSDHVYLRDGKEIVAVKLR
ncbi:MAG: hypothetical protein ACOVT5_03475, partial [Armatimonadaceae bacterium]